jgi:hypothetical protein
MGDERRRAVPERVGAVGVQSLGQNRFLVVAPTEERTVKGDAALGKPAPPLSCRHVADLWRRGRSDRRDSGPSRGWQPSSGTAPSARGLRRQKRARHPHAHEPRVRLVANGLRSGTNWRVGTSDPRIRDPDRRPHPVLAGAAQSGLVNGPRFAEPSAASTVRFVNALKSGLACPCNIV